MKFLVIFFEPDFDPHIPFQHRALIQIIMYKLFLEISRLFYLLLICSILLPEITADYFALSA